MTLPTLSVAHEVRAIAQARAAEVREIGEWDWWDTRRGDCLHAAEVVYDPIYDVAGNGVTACGRKTWLGIPGLFTRMGLPRCSRCCKRLGYPQGIGSPKNSTECRPLVEARLAAVRRSTSGN
jgi:hypothetical protein